jgi:hypothetical protein
LDAVTRAFMQMRFGRDFDRVRVHTDSKAAESARTVNALAYTVGPRVVFGVGQYAPHTAPGRALIAHELTHVLQQNQASIASSDAPSIQPKLTIGEPGDAYEIEADRVARQLMADEPGSNIAGGDPPTGDVPRLAVRASGNHSTLQRQAEFSEPRQTRPTKAPPIQLPPCPGCSLSEADYQKSTKYCRDTDSTGQLHIGKGKPWKRCYREVPERPGRECPPGCHVCFDDNGGCGAVHRDTIAPYDRGNDTNHSCVTGENFRCVIEHGLKDKVIETYLKEKAGFQEGFYDIMK